MLFLRIYAISIIFALSNRYIYYCFHLYQYCLYFFYVQHAYLLNYYIFSLNINIAHLSVSSINIASLPVSICISTRKRKRKKKALHICLFFPPACISTIFPSISTLHIYFLPCILTIHHLFNHCMNIFLPPLLTICHVCTRLPSPGCMPCLCSIAHRSEPVGKARKAFKDPCHSPDDNLKIFMLRRPT
jgi:hypothetical protein